MTTRTPESDFTHRHHGWALTLTVIGLLIVGAVSGLVLGEILVTAIRATLGHLDAGGNEAAARLLGLPARVGGAT